MGPMNRNLVIGIQFQKSMALLEKTTPFLSQSTRFISEQTGLYEFEGFLPIHPRPSLTSLHEIYKKSQDSARNRSSRLLLLSFLYFLLFD
jgi:hypothetical protein